MRYEDISPEQAMKLAIEQAWMGAGKVKTNPMVGCCIVSEDGKRISLGHHSVFGGNHAEVNAIKNLKKQSLLKGATVFVTLEPCSHVGQTPSCAHMLSQLPIKSVVYGCKDPHPIAGGGSQILSNHGIRSEKYMGLERELSELNEIFLHNVRHQSAFIALKVATSLDGSLALKNGQSQWITNEASRERAHELRARYDATLIGVNTYINDNPRLDIRCSKYKGYKNQVVILDPRGRSLKTLDQSNLLKVHDPKDICIVTMDKIENPLGIRTHIVKKSPTIDLNSLSRDLYNQFLISSVLVEGGAITHSHFINQRGAQKIHQFIAPVIIGGATGVNWTQDVKIGSMEDRIGIHMGNLERLGDNILMTGNFIDSSSLC